MRPFGMADGRRADCRRAGETRDGSARGQGLLNARERVIGSILAWPDLRFRPGSVGDGAAGCSSAAAAPKGGVEVSGRVSGVHM